MIKEQVKSSNDYFSNESSPSSLNSNWMSKVPDNKSIKDVSIPGTHDSGSRFGTVFAECQSWTIYDQCNAGLRYFDTRCRRCVDVFAIHHGPMFQHLFFGDVLNMMEKFLKENPTEGIIIRLKEEYDPMDGSDSFDNIFNKKYAAAYPNLFLFQSEIPTMQQLRGKVYALVDYGGSSLPNISWNSLSIQDDYDLGFFTSLDKKKSEIKACMENANSSDLFVANHCSATGILFEEPVFVAKNTNKFAFEILSSFNRVGIIIMDFPGCGIIKRIIDKN